MTPLPSTRTALARVGRLLASLAALLAALPAHASFMQGETLAKAANVLAIVVIIIVPIVAIVVFWMVHVLPEKIAHKRHHPQTEAIQVLCLLSLVFGGMLWPLAWLWAYRSPCSTSWPTARTSTSDSRGRRVRRMTARSRRHARRRRTPAGRTSKAAWRRAGHPGADARSATSWRRSSPGSRPRRGRRADGNPPARHLQLLRLADLHQVQVAAVEHHQPGDGRHHPDRRADGADPDAERRRAVVGGRAGVQVHGPDRLAGARPRDRGARRGGQPAGEEGRRAVPRRPDAVPADGQQPDGPAGRREGRQRAAARAVASRRPATRRRSARGSTSRRSACSRTANWRPPAPATASTSSRPRPICATSRRSSSTAIANEAQVRAQLAATVGGDIASVAKIKADLANAEWELEQTTVRSPCDCYVINLALRPGAFVAGMPFNPVMTLVEADGQVVALFNQNELHQVAPGNYAEFSLKTNPGRIIRAKVDSVIWAQGMGQMQQSGTLPMTGVLAAPPNRFAVKFDIDGRGSRTADGGGRGRPCGGLHRARQGHPHPAHGHPARRRLHGLPDPEAALMP